MQKTIHKECAMAVGLSWFLCVCATVLHPLINLFHPPSSHFVAIEASYDLTAASREIGLITPHSSIIAIYDSFCFVRINMTEEETDGSYGKYIEG